MGQSLSIASYADVRALMDRALASERGSKAKVDSPGAAINITHRMSSFRMMDRNSSKKIYSPEDPRYGTSVYDTLSLRIVGVRPDGTEMSYNRRTKENPEGTQWEVRVVKVTEETLEVEDL